MRLRSKAAQEGELSQKHYKHEYSQVFLPVQTAVNILKILTFCNFFYPSLQNLPKCNHYLPLFPEKYQPVYNQINTCRTFTTLKPA